MVANRDSLAKVGLPLCRLIHEGYGGSAEVMELAKRLKSMLLRSGTYRKKYTDPTERVLHRHLNLYRNKKAKAKTDVERERWAEKIAEQQEKISQWKANQLNLDLDGL